MKNPWGLRRRTLNLGYLALRRVPCGDPPGPLPHLAMKPVTARSKRIVCQQADAPQIPGPAQHVGVTRAVIDAAGGHSPLTPRCSRAVNGPVRWLAARGGDRPDVTYVSPYGVC
jgi:hypothetical protein